VEQIQNMSPKYQFVELVAFAEDTSIWNKRTFNLNEFRKTIWVDAFVPSKNERNFWNLENSNWRIWKSKKKSFFILFQQQMDFAALFDVMRTHSKK
jgi:hypothetical protein